MPLPIKGQRTATRETLAAASDEYVRLPLWEFHPSCRLLVLRERRRRYGVPTEEDFDPEYH